MVIHAGTYTTPGYYEVRWAGTASAPIVVSGAPGESRPAMVGNPSQNVIDLSGSHFVLSRIEIRGGSQGIRLGDVSHATLADLVVHDLVNVGISCDSPGDLCEHVTIRDSQIYDTGHDGNGEGMYLGCQSANCVFEHGVVERNVVHDTGSHKGDGIQIKPGSFANVVRDNHVYDTTFPGITIYGCRDPIGMLNLIERNVASMTGGIFIIGRAIVHANRVIGQTRRFRALAGCRLGSAVSPKRRATVGSSAFVGAITRGAANRCHGPRLQAKATS